MKERKFMEICKLGSTNLGKEWNITLFSECNNSYFPDNYLIKIIGITKDKFEEIVLTSGGEFNEFSHYFTKEEDCNKAIEELNKLYGDKFDISKRKE